MERTYKDSPRCPRCDQPEDFTHVIKCGDEEATNIWRTNIGKAITIIQKNIGPQAAFVTEQHLLAWRENTTVPNSLYIPPELRELISAQSTLGWTAFHFGRVAIQWQYCTTSTDKYNNPKRWVYALIQKLCLTVWNMWDHRNTVLHDPAGRVRMTETIQLNARIRYEYMLGSFDLDPEDQQLLLKSVDYICNKSSARKIQWLASVSQARIRASQPRQNPQHNPESSTNTTTEPNTNTSPPPTALTSWLKLH